MSKHSSSWIIFWLLGAGVVQQKGYLTRRMYFKAVSNKEKAKRQKYWRQGPASKLSVECQFFQGVMLHISSIIFMDGEWALG